MAFSPLDDELGLLPGRLTPRLQENLARLGTWLPSFAKAADELAYWTQVDVSRATATRITEAAGAAAVAVHTAEVARIEADYPTAPVTPDTLLVSVDGAMVPLQHGEWAEVKTLAIGDVQPPILDQGELVVHTANLSYFSRLTDSTTFERLALGELQRRGIERAQRVAAVMDGAVWLQGFVDLHCPEAVRILDFAHAVEYLTAIGQTLGPAGRLLPAAEVSRLAHDLKHAGPDTVLATVRDVVAAHPDLPDLATQAAYLEKRVAQLQYPQFQAAGYPLGSGSVESSHTVVVEARLNGAGMRWAREHVNPMLALRNAVCNDRWVEVWGQIETEQRRQVAARRRERRQQRQPTHADAPPCPGSRDAAPVVPEHGPTNRRASAPPLPCPGVPAAPPEAPKPWRPAADHPWRRAWSPRRQLEQTRAS